MEKTYTNRVESVNPYSGSGSKREEIEQMFDNISPRYDLLNSLLSIGIDKVWRNKLSAMVDLKHPRSILDVATGTAELALTLARVTDAKITGVDISTGMLEIGRKKILQRKLHNRIELVEADSLQLPFEDNTFDAVTVAFGVRNFASLDKGIAEMMRVLKTGHTLFILEFSNTRGTWINPLFAFYFRFILPFIGRFISKDKAAYEYLPNSVAAFPAGKEFCELLLSCGASSVKMKKLTAGIVTIYAAEKKSI